MWWKLTALACGTILLCLAVIPIRTHAVMFDPLRETPPPKPSPWAMLSNLHFTPGTLALIGAILLGAGFIAVRIIRGEG